MGFNLVDIISKFVPIRPHSSSADGWEDPFGSGKGQIVVSEKEAMKKRMARQGQVKSGYASKVALTAGTPIGVLGLAPQDGFVAIPLKLSVSVSAPALVYLQWDQRQNQSTENGIAHNIFTCYLPNAGNWTVDFNGEVLLGNGTNASLNATADSAGAFAWASFIYAEELE